MSPRNFFLLLLALVLLLPPISGSAQGSFPHLFRLDSRVADTVATPVATSQRHRYRVTAWGTYSMWEDTVNSSVDPVWIYSFPDEEWDKPEWRIFTEGYPIYVGDNRMFDSHGLRVDDRPFPKLPLRQDHRYSFVMQGTGRPITTALVDWNFRGLQKRDAHDNNSGFLSVLIEELPLTEVEICSVDSTDFPTIRVGVKVMRDSIRIEDLQSILAIRENGADVIIDSIDCGERLRPVSVGLVVDRSGSMDETWGSTTRMSVVTTAARGFVQRLADEDEGALFSFGTDVRRDQDYTFDHSLLEQGIGRLAPRGYTAMNDAVYRAVSEAATRPESFRRAVVLLSDGEDNISRRTSIDEVASHARALGIPVFAIGLLLDSDDSLRALAAKTDGAYFAVSNPGAIDSVFATIAELLFEKGCCNVWYRTPSSRRDGTWRGVDVVIAYPDDTTAISDEGYRAPEGTSSVVGELTRNGVRVSFDASRRSVSLISPAGVPIDRVQAFSSIGRSIVTENDVVGSGGRYSIDLSSAPGGPLFIVVTSGGVSEVFPILNLPQW